MYIDSLFSVHLYYVFVYSIFLQSYYNGLQWNLRTTDTLGAGTSSVVERLSASGGFDKIN